MTLVHEQHGRTDLLACVGSLLQQQSYMLVPLLSLSYF